VAYPLTRLSHSAATFRGRRGASALPTARVFGKPLSEDLPSFQAVRFLACCCFRCFCAAPIARRTARANRSFSIVENRRLLGGKTVQRTVLYLGEINDQQQVAWRKTLDVFDEDEQCYTTMSLFPDDREVPADALDSVQVKLSGLELRRPRIFGSLLAGV